MRRFMRNSMAVFIALAVLAAGGAAWADTTTVSVTANVTGTCKFASSGSIAFALDPSSASDATGVVVQPTFWCTKGASYTITDDIGANEAVPNTAPRRMKHATLTEYIPYGFTYTATGTGAGKTPATSMNIAATVTNANFVNTSSGSYADTVTLTIAP
jgi:spore coat protein U-like protein